MRKWLRHAFAIEPAGPAEPTELEAPLIDRLAREIVRRGLAAPALLFLEVSHPLNFVGSQALLFFGPLAELIFPRDSYRAVTRFLERRGSIEYVCRRIEAFDAEARIGPGAGGRADHATACASHAGTSGAANEAATGCRTSRSSSNHDG